MKNQIKVALSILVVAAIGGVFYQNCSPAKYKGNSKAAPSKQAFQFYWVPEPWGDCAGNSQTRTASCYDGGTGLVADASKCDGSTSLVLERDCSDKTLRSYVQETPADHLQVDILVIVDDSGSMAVEQTKLAQRFGGFIDDLGASGLDWQACLTTTDVGHYQGWPVNWKGSTEYLLTPAIENYAQIFKDTINAVGSGYSDDEQGIGAANMAVTKNVTHHCFRDKAALAIIIISDEDERSVGGNSSLSNKQYKALGALNTPVSLMNNIKTTFGVNKRFDVNSIVVKDAVCEADQTKQGSPGFIGKQYIELSNLSGGYSGSICAADYTENLRFFQEKIQHTVTISGEISLG